MAHQKLSDADLARLRALAAEGWSQSALADEFGVGRQYVSRLLRGVQRPVIAGLAATEVRSGGVLGALEAFLAGRAVGDGDQVLAAMARALAAKLDSCTGSETAAAAGAAPRVAQTLVDVLERLRSTGPHEPTPLDLLQRRREARILLRAASGNGHPQHKGSSHEQ